MPRAIIPARVEVVDEDLLSLPGRLADRDTALRTEVDKRANSQGSALRWCRGGDDRKWKSLSYHILWAYSVLLDEHADQLELLVHRSSKQVFRWSMKPSGLLPRIVVLTYREI